MSAVLCPECRTPIERREDRLGTARRCPACRKVLSYVFPTAFEIRQRPKHNDLLTDDSDCMCYQHPEKAAVAACDRCGRFVCALCEIPLGPERLCPLCLAGGRKGNRPTSLENHRVVYDKMALALAIIPVLFFYLTIMTAPAALFICIRYWNAETSLVRRSKWRFVVAGTIATLQIVGWLALAVGFISQMVR